MAQVVVPGSPTTNPPAQATHGKKRAADNSLEPEQRLSKRFDLLNLVDSNGSRLYIPVPGSQDATLPHPHPSPVATPDSLTFIKKPKPQRARPSAPRSDSDAMLVEDTPHRVYIHDLSAELSDIESDEDTPIFLSDIEKHLSKIPKHVLLRPEPKANENNQVVLYNVPTSLSVPQERDGVRKAIVEARQRIRDRQGNPLAEPRGMLDGAGHGARIRQIVDEDADADADAMDID